LRDNKCYTLKTAQGDDGPWTNSNFCDVTPNLGGYQFRAVFDTAYIDSIYGKGVDKKIWIGQYIGGAWKYLDGSLVGDFWTACGQTDPSGGPNFCLMINHGTDVCPIRVVGSVSSLSVDPCNHGHNFLCEYF
jgi:hypothetical protein